MTPNFLWMHVIVGQSGQQPNPHIDFLNKNCLFLSLHGLRSQVPGKNMQTSQVDPSTLLSWDHGWVFPERSWWYSRKGVPMNTQDSPIGTPNNPVGVWVCVKKSWILFKLQLRYKSLWEEFSDIGHFDHRTWHGDRSIIFMTEINVMPLAQIAQPPDLRPLWRSEWWNSSSQIMAGNVWLQKRNSTPCSTNLVSGW